MILISEIGKVKRLGQLIIRNLKGHEILLKFIKDHVTFFIQIRKWTTDEHIIQNDYEMALENAITNRMFGLVFRLLEVFCFNCNNTKK